LIVGRTKRNQSEEDETAAIGRQVLQGRDAAVTLTADVDPRLPSAVGLTTASAPEAAAAATNPDWLQRYARALVVADGAVLFIAVLAALAIRFSTIGTLGGLSYAAVAALLALLWWAVLGLSRCYETRFLGSGNEEFKRVGNASVRVAALVAFTAYSFKLPIARGFVGIALPLGMALLLLVRCLGRLWLQSGRRRDRNCHRVVVVGTRQHVADLATQLAREPLAGFRVIGACLAGSGQRLVVAGQDVPVLGALGSVVAAARRHGADTIAVAASPGINGEALRRLAYELEGTGIDLLVAPALTNVTGTRVSIRPVAGLPLLHVDEPELAGSRKLLKAAFDRSVALLLLLLSSPFLLAIALSVKITSRGPAIFRQQRVGRDGELFWVWKFRSMTQNAEERLIDLARQNEHDGILFKMRQDPRVTPVGRFLRKYSLDELPQFFNVLTGSMSLVGPRPPLPSEVERYEGHAHRRLLVKPGVTGLWQVSGRSELSWEETVRLDLRYVESWSLGLDLVVIAKTALAVLRGRGAY